jgi:hypothetical protein
VPKLLRELEELRAREVAAQARATELSTSLQRAWAALREAEARAAADRARAAAAEARAASLEAMLGGVGVGGFGGPLSRVLAASRE